MNALDTVLLAYRETFGVKTERGNEIHRDACIEVARLREEKAELEVALKIDDALAQDSHSLCLWIDDNKNSVVAQVLLTRSLYVKSRRALLKGS